MEDTLVRDALQAHVAAEPPLRLTSAGVIAAGRRSRRLHRAGIAAAGAAAVAGFVGVAALVMLPMLPGRGDNGLIASPPDPAVCAALRETTPGPGITEPEAADRLSCYLLQAVPRMFPPGTIFTDNAARAGTVALVAADDPMGLEGDLAATAVVQGQDGTGLVIVSVARAPDINLDDLLEMCNAPDAKAACLTGPHGEHIEVYDFGPDDLGVHGRTIYVYSGHTRILAGAHNRSESDSDSAPATRGEPPLTVEQLIQLATNQALVLYP